MAEQLKSKVIQPERIQRLNRKGLHRGDYVLYWMQQSQRAEDNHALEYAIEQANHLNLPVLVVFGLTDHYPDANLRHYRFMLEGLRETAGRLRKRGIQLAVQQGDPAEIAHHAGRRAAMIVCDRGYLKHQRSWRRRVAERAGCCVIQVESDVVVPLERVSRKAEYAARTIRPKIQKHLKQFLQPIAPLKLMHSSLKMNPKQLRLENIGTVLDRLNIDRSVSPVTFQFRGGAAEANNRFDAFVMEKLKYYDDHTNQPQTDDVSLMSPYLHFGQISSLALALKVMSSDRRKTGTRNVDAFLEQLIIRRELAANFVYHTHGYDTIGCIPKWARQTIETHASDKREHIYSSEEMDQAQTHDPYWNAAMREMKYTGFMHNYMRMYWGKKILEWSRTPEEAFETTLALNNRYFLDGRDPNSYAGVAWIYGVHDRAWAERPIYGKIRYMAASGLERKCDIDAYVKKVEKRIGKEKILHQ